MRTTCFSGHQMSGPILKWTSYTLSPMLGGWDQEGPCTVRSNVSWVMVTWDPLQMDRKTNREKWLKTLTSLNFIGDQ